jgi:hypothetical protein
MKLIRVIFYIVSTVFFAACGGGGSGSSPNNPISQLPVNAANKYVGYWIGQCFRKGTMSQRKFVEIATISGTSISFKTTEYDFSGMVCMDGGKVTETITGKIELTGVKIIEGNISVETGILSFDGSGIAPIKNIYRANSYLNQGAYPNQLFEGDFKSIDSEGYPTNLDTVDYLFRA